MEAIKRVEETLSAEALRKIMGVIVVKKYAFDVEVLAIANMLKMRIMEAPVRIEQESMFSLRAAMQMLIDLMGIFYRLRVVRWYQKNLEKQNPEYKPVLPL